MMFMKKWLSGPEERGRRRRRTSSSSSSTTASTSTNASTTSSGSSSTTTRSSGSSSTSPPARKRHSRPSSKKSATATHPKRSSTLASRHPHHKNQPSSNNKHAKDLTKKKKKKNDDAVVPPTITPSIGAILSGSHSEEEGMPTTLSAGQNMYLTVPGGKADTHIHCSYDSQLWKVKQLVFRMEPRRGSSECVQQDMYFKIPTHSTTVLPSVALEEKEVEEEERVPDGNTSTVPPPNGKSSITEK
jgi:hypothetical protein